VTASSSGKYAASVKVATKGKFSYRVYRAATTTLSSGVSKTEHITVR
jgi:VCBS repeat-containing protein